MERTMTIEEKIRRAEEIYERRRQGNARPIATVNVNNKKDIKLLKKMIIQILVCVSIYLIIYTIQNGNYIFSGDFIKKTNELLSYDINFGEMYENVKSQISNMINNNKINNSENDGIGGAEENTQENAVEDIVENTVENQTIEQNQEQTTQNLSQEEQDILNIHNTATFIKPVEGIISSKYGQREEATGTVPKNHTGTDIAANIGTKIVSATDGEVVLKSEEGDYRKTFKNTNRRCKYNICSL